MRGTGTVQEGWWTDGRVFTWSCWSEIRMRPYRNTPPHRNPAATGKLLFHFFIVFISGIQSLEMSLDSGSSVLHVCLHPRFVRLTAPANNKKRRAADSEPGDSCQATGGCCLARVRSRRSQSCRGWHGPPGARSCLRPWHSGGPARAPFN